MRTEQADADLVVAKARAEERLAMAEAREQEMKAKSQEIIYRIIVDIAKNMPEDIKHICVGFTGF